MLSQENDLIYVGAVTEISNLIPLLRQPVARNNYQEVERILLKMHREISSALGAVYILKESSHGPPVN